MKHSQIRELLGAYAVDAVEETERRAVELHLDTCAECMAEVGAHLEASSFLAAEPAPARSDVWNRIQESVREDGARVVPLRRRPLIRRLTTGMAVAAVAAAVLVAANAVSEQRRLERRVDELASTLGHTTLESAAQAALLHPSAREVTLRSADESAVVQLVYLPGGQGYLVRDNLARLPEGRAYQLWALIGDAKVSTGVLGRDPGLTPFTAGAGVEGFAITAEDGQGATQPAGDPVVVGFLT